MNIFPKLIKNRINLFIFVLTFTVLAGSFFVHSRYQAQPIKFSTIDSLEGVLELSPSRIQVTEDIYNADKIHTASLKISLKNNSAQTLTGVKLVMGDKGLGYLESPSALHFTHLLPRENEIIFNLADLPAGGKSQGEISVYAQKKGIYVIKVDVETDQKVRATSSTINNVTLTAE